MSRARIALCYRDETFSAISGVCNHAGGPRGAGSLDGEYVTCPWHFWKFHCRTGKGEPGFEEDRVPTYPVKVENGRVLIDIGAPTPRTKKPHAPHPLARPIKRAPGPIRVIGISTTVMHPEHAHYSTSDALLETALAHAKTRGCEAEVIYLRKLNFRHSPTSRIRADGVPRTWKTIPHVEQSEALHEGARARRAHDRDGEAAGRGNHSRGGNGRRRPQRQSARRQSADLKSAPAPYSSNDICLDGE